MYKVSVYCDGITAQRSVVTNKKQLTHNIIPPPLLCSLLGVSDQTVTATARTVASYTHYAIIYCLDNRLHNFLRVNIGSLKAMVIYLIRIKVDIYKE